ncbi:5'-3' exoribonuclease 1 (ISS) [Thraustotheca clavata]|uniref:5'-3' exoribonuclease 1 n=1 Tax=Thraustotheca clavata TaxID=74557 RepID=A0A1W0A9T1_9STRA|nr:5'-3' exoribonuclease 1 (ISS) [Thraustotheca clavata]
MGIPRFFRWVSERYPQINQQISDVSLLPEFDNLYLDLNGIIHQCTHPNDQEVCEQLGDEQQIPAIFAYIDRIVTHIVKPKQLLFLAVDGVAPRAKLNQQRSRRFRAGLELQEKNQALAKERGDDDEDTPKKALFDSNCITPGTEFMYRLSNHLQYFIRKKLKEDPTWRNLTVIFSGQEVPGEGEHKIVEYIRRTKMQPGYPPNVRHCMYGSDADLMLLGLMTHEPHFTLLREVVDFSGGRRSAKDENTKKIVARQTKEQEWQLVHLSIFRQYLNMELYADVPWYDTERALDDFILLTFLLGNDFIPHSPTLDISEDAIALLMEVYRSKLPEWGDFITRGGTIQRPEHFEDLCRTIGEMEESILTTRADEERKFQQNKRYGRAPKPSKPMSVTSDDSELDAEDAFASELLAALTEPVEIEHEMAVLSGSPAFQATKWNYYSKKFGLSDTRPELLMDVKTAYIEALVWCLGYYFQGVPSWSWFYPFHYSPMISDLTDIASIISNMKLEVGTPFLPFQQLMSTLPPTSANLVPQSYQQLILDPNSPISAFYPATFEIDMEGKRNPWEGVNLLPFIDSSKLLDAIDEYCPDDVLSDTDRARNRVGFPLKFTCDVGAMETVPSTLPRVFDDMPLCHSKKEVYVLPPLSNFDCSLMDGVQIPIAGFPSLFSLPISAAYLNNIGVNCFGMSSKKKTMVLAIEPKSTPTAEDAATLVRSTVHVNYPNMHEAYVEAVSTIQGTCRAIGDEDVAVNAFDDSEKRQWQKTANIESERYLKGRATPGTGGLRIGEITAFVHVRPLQGMITDPATGAVFKKFGTDEVMIPYQLVATNLATTDSRFAEKPPVDFTERFPINCPVLITSDRPEKGAKGQVVGHENDHLVVEVEVPTPEPPFGYAIADAIVDKYFPSHVVSQRLGISPSTLGRITGSLLVNPGRYDIGLNLKYKKELALAGYCRYEPKLKERNSDAWTTGDSVAIIGTDADVGADVVEGAWEYSDKAFHLILAYQRKFPQVFQAVESVPYQNTYDGSSFFGVPPSSIKALLETIKTWLAQLDIATVPLVPVTSQSLSTAAVKAIEKAGEIRASAPVSKANIHVAPSELFRVVGSNYDLSSTTLEKSSPCLGDRVVNLSARTVPFGHRGTIIATHAVSGCVEVVFDATFSGGNSLHGHCAPYRGKLVPWTSLLLVSTRPASLTKAQAPQTAPKRSVEVMKKKLGPKEPQYAPKDSYNSQRTEQDQRQRRNLPMQSSLKEENLKPKSVPKQASLKVAAPKKDGGATPPAPALPSTDKMNKLIMKWAKEEEVKKKTINRNLEVAPANSMAQYFQRLQTEPLKTNAEPAKSLLQPTAAPFHPPLPPQPHPSTQQQQPYNAAPVVHHPPPPPPRQVYRQKPKPASSKSGLLIPSQVLRTKYSSNE